MRLKETIEWQTGQIAELQETVQRLRDDKTRLLDMLQLALAGKPLAASTERTRRWRERHSDGHGDASRERDPLERVSLPVLVKGDDVTPDPPKGSTHSGGGTSRERHSDAFDRERAEADASERGIAGASFEAELQRFTDYWDSAGWKRKGGAVKDRNATWRSWLDSPYRKSASNGNGHATTDKNDPDYSGIVEWGRRHGVSA